jgi:hypothetical protein
VDSINSGRPGYHDNPPSMVDKRVLKRSGNALYLFHSAEYTRFPLTARSRASSSGEAPPACESVPAKNPPNESIQAAPCIPAPVLT